MESKQVKSADFLLDQQESKNGKGPVKREFVIAEDMKELATSIINEQKLDVHPAKIEYLLVYPNISKTSAGKIIKTGRELKFFSELDYIVEISGELWDALDEETRNILLEHELRHILVVENEKTGDWTYKLRKHDLQDFSKLVAKHGAEWVRTVKLSLSSIYGLTPAEEDNIQI